MSLPYAFVNGEITLLTNASISVTDLSIQRGYGVFDYFNYAYGTNNAIDLYLDRLYNSAEKAYLSIPYDRSQLLSHINVLYRKNNVELCNMKVIVTAGNSSDGFTAPGISNIIVISYPQKVQIQDMKVTGARLISHPYQRPWPEIKSINYFCSAILARKMHAENAVDVLYIDHNQIRETSRANIFMVKGDQISTPGNQILHGITRHKILNNTLSYSIKVTDISKEELMAADEIFITSTTKYVLPITHIDNVQIGNGQCGPVSMHLMDWLSS
jgi:branched-chain amino acid aminotransferase